MLDEQTERELQVYRSGCLNRSLHMVASGSLYGRLGRELSKIVGFFPTYLSIDPECQYTTLKLIKVSNRFSIRKIDLGHSTQGVVVENE